MTVVGAVGCAVIVVGLCKDEDVLATAEGVGEDGGGTKVDVRVAAGGLVGGRAIKVPNAELANVSDLLADGLGRMSGMRGRMRRVYEPWSLSAGHRHRQSRRLGEMSESDEQRNGNAHSAWILSPWGSAR